MARTRKRPSGLKYTTVKQFQKIRNELDVDGDVLRVIGSYIGFKMPMTQAHYLTYKLNKEFHGRYKLPAQEDTVFLVWNRWDLRYKKNNHGWRHVQRIAGDVDKYERIQHSRYRTEDWVPIYNGDRCTPTFYDRWKRFRIKDPIGYRGNSRINEFDRKYSYGAMEKWNLNNIPEPYFVGTMLGEFEEKPSNERRFYHGIHNLHMELSWLGYYRRYQSQCRERGWVRGFTDSLVLMNICKITDYGWNGFFIRYDILNNHFF
jgi:hypothetical protein